MGVKLTGKPVVESLRENIKSRVATLGEKNIQSDSFINQSW